MKENRDINEQAAFVLTFHICFMQCKNMLVSTSEALYALNSKLNIVAMILVAILYGWLFLFHNRFRFMNRKVFWVIFSILIWWGISYVIDPKLFTDTTFPYSYVQRQATTFIAYCFPLFLVSSYITDARALLNKLYRAVPISFLVATISMFLYIVDPSSSLDKGYSMSYGNQMLLSCVILVFRYIDEHKKRDIFMFIATVIYIFIGGSRGSLVSIFVLFLYWLFTIKPVRKRNLSVVLLSFAIIPVLIFWEDLLMLLYKIFNNMGINSRSLYMMVNDIGAYDSGRSFYHEALFNALNQSPFWGLGAFGGEKTVGLAHSLYIDILANFGYILGVGFILLLIWKIFSQMMKRGDKARNEVIAMMAIILFPRGFFDETFWGAWPLWVIMGLLFGSRNIVRSEMVIYEASGNQQL